MDGLAIADFLATHETGVLALGRANTAYAVPMSYAFDREESALYFRFGIAGDSRKRDFLEATETASFVVYEHAEAGWTSVLAEGPLDTVADSNVAAAVEESVRGLSIPYFDVHGPDPDLEFHTVRLSPRTLTGVREG